jgi:hypothetical protein
MTTPNNQPKPPVKYTGPAKPIPTHREPMGDKALLIWFAVLAAVFVVLLLLEVI